jgi:hypothetical protein
MELTKQEECGAILMDGFAKEKTKHRNHLKKCDRFHVFRYIERALVLKKYFKLLF